MLLCTIPDDLLSSNRLSSSSKMMLPTPKQHVATEKNGLLANLAVSYATIDAVERMGS